jgi:carbamoyl-phosphate synthase large subunit
MNKPKKVLILGSGGLQVGQAGEFDYSGSQAIKAMKEEGIFVVLVNPNIATIQTDEKLADKIYFLPVTPYFVGKIIEKERPDAILLSFGGQTALNCGVELNKKGILKEFNVNVLGTSVKTIEDTEDRELFVNRLKEISVSVPKSIATKSTAEAVEAAKKIGYPVMLRIAYALGGLGSGVAYEEKTLREITMHAFSYSPQVLVEEYLEGWKEVEYEVVRDCYDNCITVCNMENFDPMGIHTGESIVVAPSQTLTNEEYHKLRAVSIKVIRHLGIVGECNIQFALDPKSEEYRIIEVNARLSRSSALASKATGYPLAFIAAKLALGYSLTELKNSVTQITQACFEPALDYIVVKIPRWDLKKFKKISKRIGSSMKSVGEVMAIGRKFEEALQKAIRMLEIDMRGIVCNDIKFEDLEDELKNPTDERVFAVAEAIKNNVAIDRIYELTGIDKWFLYKIKNVVDLESEIKKGELSKEILRKAKQLGFSDSQIAFMLDKKEIDVTKLRKSYGIKPVVKQIDTLGAEYPAKTNYLYLTYNGDEDDISFEDKNKVIVLGSGVYRIGSSVEFDWCCVNAVLSLKNLNYRTIMINYNPETVSTDYDICDKLYFEELSFETVAEIYEKENPLGVIISMGGQIPNNLAMPCSRNGIKVLGTPAEGIDNAEDRDKFSMLLDSLGIDQPKWRKLTSIAEAVKFGNEVGYPVLVRPSYVLSGAAMNVAYDDVNLERFLHSAAKVSKEHPVVISKFIRGAKEIEIDAVASNGKIIAEVIIEHVENAGVHSGDATFILPPQKLYFETIKKVKNIAFQISSALKITGPFNIQFIARKNEIKVIECNLRASRSFPFDSKVMKINFAELATKAVMGHHLDEIDRTDVTYVGIKTPQFSFTRFKGADPVLGVEMASTGEVACLGDDVYEALLKAIMSTGFEMPKKNILVSISGEKNRYDFVDSFKTLKKLGYSLYSTDNTHKFLEKEGIESTMLYKIHEKKKPNVLDFLVEKKIDMVINIPREPELPKQMEDIYKMRRAAIDMAIPLLTNIQMAKLFIESLSRKKLEDLKIKSWDEYNGKVKAKVH